MNIAQCSPLSQEIGQAAASHNSLEIVEVDAILEFGKELRIQFDGSVHYPLEQRTLPWSILPVGEANGNFLIRQAASNGSYPLEGGILELAHLAQRTLQQIPVKSTALLRVAVARFFWAAGARAVGRGPPFSRRLGCELFSQ